MRKSGLFLRTMLFFFAGILLSSLIPPRPALAQFPSTATHNFASCNFPDTNQVGSYTSTLGEDHDYGSTETDMRFTVYVIGTSSVTVDDRTGLMWESTGSCNGGTLNSTAAITCCESSTFAGFTDWRLPNAKEIISIMDLSKTVGPWINANAFPNTFGGTDYYWTSTTLARAGYTMYGYRACFGGNILLGGAVKTGAHYVRCVRAGPP